MTSLLFQIEPQDWPHNSGPLLRSQGIGRCPKIKGSFVGQTAHRKADRDMILKQKQLFQHIKPISSILRATTMQKDSVPSIEAVRLEPPHIKRVRNAIEQLLQDGYIPNFFERLWEEVPWLLYFSSGNLWTGMINQIQKYISEYRDLSPELSPKVRMLEYAFGIRQISDPYAEILQKQEKPFTRRDVSSLALEVVERFLYQRNQTAPSVILEAGIGTGIDTAYFAQHAKVIACDRSSTAIALTLQRICQKQSPYDVSFFCGHLHFVPLVSGWEPNLIFSQSLVHLIPEETIDPTLQHAYKLLLPKSGRMIIAVKTKEHLFPPDGFELIFSKELRMGSDCVLRTLRSDYSPYLQKAGFSTVECRRNIHPMLYDREENPSFFDVYDAQI